MELEPQKYDFTILREGEFFDALAFDKLKQTDSEVIFNMLKSKMQVIPFCDYLKRYIYLKAEMTGDWEEIPVDEYQRYIINSFKLTHTPPSFEPTTSKLSALAKNWLKQTAVSRNTILLLGFGLKMTCEEVSAFLKRTPLEGDFNMKNPFEIVCCYCYKNGLAFSKMQELMESYNRMLGGFTSALVEGKTVGIKRAFENASSDKEILLILKQYNLTFENAISQTANIRFFELYNEIRRIIAARKQVEEDLGFSEKLSDYKGRLLKNSKLFDFERVKHKNEFEKKRKIYSFEEVSESEVEKYLCSGTPIDKNGNLTKISSSSLASNFSKKRLSKQRINDIFAGNATVDKFDIITMNFFIHAEKNAEISNNSRWWSFVEDTNRLLDECSMGELYIANPYDCFLQICMLSDTPIAAYDEVIARSYDEEI